MKVYLLLCIMIILLPIVLPAQIGYYISRSVKKPDTTFYFGSTALPVALNREDVRAIGMGKAQIALGRTFNAMMYNPALLSRSKFNIEALSLNLSLPPQTYEAANFLKDHISEFKNALSLNEVWEGINDFKAAQADQNIQGQLAALQRIQDGLRFPRDLLNKVVGTSDHPITHGIRILPAFALHVGNFGFSLYGISQSGFQMQQSPIIDALLAVHIPNDLNNPDEVARAILSLEAPLQAVYNTTTGSISPDVYPVAYAVSFLDIVGAAGYAYNITPNLAIGANLKVIHRRFSTKRIVVDNYDKILTDVRNDLNSYITGVTLDLGALYKFPTGTTVGLSLQNIIPAQKLTSHLRATVPVQYFDYDRDQNGRIIIRGQDTALVNYSIDVNLDLPFDLKLPFIVNMGASQQITRNFDVAFDWVDIADQEEIYDKYTERLRIGAEYRLDAIEKMLGIIGRVGFADDHPTFGIGLNLFRAVQIDGAYAWDSFVDTYSYFAQLRIGW